MQNMKYIFISKPYHLHNNIYIYILINIVSSVHAHTQSCKLLNIKPQPSREVVYIIFSKLAPVAR